MGGYIVIQHNDHDDLIDGKSYLSVYSVPEFALIQSHILPIYERGCFVGSHCKGLYFFTDFMNNFVLINLTTKVFKPLSLPKLKPTLIAEYHTCGIGLDPVSGVFKIVAVYHFSKIDKYGRDLFQGGKNRVHLYSLDTDSWTEVGCPHSFTSNSDSVYVGHKRYWTAMTNRPDPDPPVNGVFSIKDDVVSFNFRSNKFTVFPLPRYPPGKLDYVYDLLEYDGMLGAIGYSRNEDPTDYDIWVYKERSWRLARTFSFGCVEKALALKDDRFLFFAVPCMDDVERREVHVVDVFGGRLIKDLNIYGQEFKLGALPFDENPYPLPGGQPLIESYSDDKGGEIGEKEKEKEKEEEKNSSSRK